MTPAEYEACVAAIIARAPRLSPEKLAALAALLPPSNSEAGPASPANARIHKDTTSDNKANGHLAA